jgi:hypothetical protein
VTPSLAPVRMTSSLPSISAVTPIAIPVSIVLRDMKFLLENVLPDGQSWYCDGQLNRDRIPLTDHKT